MNRTTKNILAVAGVIATILGIVGAIPSFLQGNYLLATILSIFIIGGIILLAIAFGE